MQQETMTNIEFDNGGDDYEHPTTCEKMTSLSVTTPADA